MRSCRRCCCATLLHTHTHTNTHTHTRINRRRHMWHQICQATDPATSHSRSRTETLPPAFKEQTSRRNALSFFQPPSSLLFFLLMIADVEKLNNRSGFFLLQKWHHCFFFSFLTFFLSAIFYCCISCDRTMVYSERVWPRLCSHPSCSRRIQKKQSVNNIII